MLANISDIKNESLLLELSEGENIGTIGGYCEEGFPIYYADNQMAHMLGYEDVDDLVAGIDGKVSNTIHPEDRERVVRELNNGRFYEGMTYKVTYRMPRKDGTLLWTVDKGKVIRAQDGRLAILSICSDMTAFLDHHAQLEFACREQDELLKEQLHVFDALARGFQNVFWINLTDGTAKILKLKGYITSGLDKEDHKFFDYSTILNKYIAERVHPEDKQFLYDKLCIAHLRKVFENRSEYTGNYRVLVDGEVHHYQYNLSRTEGVAFLTCGFQNIDAIIEEHLEAQRIEREKEAAHQREMAASYEKLNEMHEILAASKMGTWNIYLLDGQIPRMEADDLMLELLGVAGKDLSPEEVYDAWFSNITPDALPSVLDSVEKMKKGELDENTYLWMHPVLGERYVRCGGTAKPVEGGFVLRGYYYDVDEDIREQQKTDKAMAEQVSIINTLSRSFKNVFVANLNNGTARVVWLADDYDVRAVIAVREKEFPYDLVIKQWIQENVHPDDRAKVEEAFSFENLRIVFSKQDEYSGTYRSTECGKLHHYQFDFRKSDDNGNVVAGFQVIDAIVEEQERQAKREKQQQEALKQALAAAQQANKAKTTFLNSMSHDIRTPMNAIIGFTALAQTHSDDRAQVQDYLGKISTSSTHLLSLINDILDMSRIESGTVKLEETQVHIPDLLHDLRTMIQSLIRSKNQNLFIDTQDVVHEDVVTDRLRLNQILLNIVGNAIKFTQPGGDIMIRLVEKPCSLRNYTTYEFSVKDNGIGMSKAYLAHIFESFSREYSATVSGIQGTGLGMSITKNIVDMMGGDIRVESEEGKGSLFTVTLHLRIAGASVKNEPIPELLGARALIVDDDMDTCRSVSKMLRDIQMRPDWTTSAREAIVRAQDATELRDEYKVLIIDYLMPDMNGIEIVRRIRKVISAEVPIIVLTAYDWADFESEARAAGVTAFVSKPIFMSELRSVLTRPAGREGTEEKRKRTIRDYSGKRVLLVEDNELNREIATTLLEETGMTVDSVNDGDIAVSTINKAPSDRYDLIFMDIQMPKMDGYTATREIRTLSDNRKANIPIVAMTANAFEEDKRKSCESGMNGHIIKPINMEAIAAVLDAIFAKERDHTEAYKL